MRPTSRRKAVATFALIAATAAWTCALDQVSASAARAEEDALSKFPIVIGCKYKTTYHVFYLSHVSQDGMATYTASDKIAGQISLDGRAKAVGGEGGGSCVGKTLDELRASGQAHDLKH